MPHSARRINAIARHCGGSRYLEIGVAEGTTFFSVKMPHKVAVDPAFQFDPEERGGDGMYFFPQSSDDFFAQFASRPEASAFKTAEGKTLFDVIFIDGLHTYEQTMRDFNNSLRFAHEHTVWLIDDTVPDDPYSALPDQKRSLAYKKRVGVLSASWHGDVYKMVFALHDLYPDFSYCTIMDRGNPQTMVWRAGRSRPRKPEFPSPNDIGHLDYFSIMEYCHLFMPVNEVGLVERIGSCPDPIDFRSPDLWKTFLYRPLRTQSEIELLSLMKLRNLTMKRPHPL